MRGRKQLLTILALAALSAASCEKYDDTEVTSALEAQERTMTRQGEAIASLERNLAETNTNLSSLGTLIAGYSASEGDKVTIRSYIPLEGGKGYTVTLTDGNTITIYNGSDGKDGSDGKNGSDGKDGSDGVVPIRGENGNWVIGGIEIPNPSDGKDGLVPHVGENGNWYIGDTDTGVRGTGQDGRNGSDGEVPTIGDNGNWIVSGTEIPNPSDGKDGLVPYIGENSDWWIGDTDTGVRYYGKDGKAAREITIGINEVDGVQVWSVYGKPLTDSEGNPVPVVGEAGKDGTPGTSVPGEPGKDGLSPRIKVMDGWLCYSFDNTAWRRICPSKGKQGDPGAPGADGVSFVKAVAPSSDGKRMGITLADGSVWSMAVGTSSYYEISKDKKTLTVFLADTSVVFKRVKACTFTMGDGYQTAYYTGEGVINPAHQVTLTKDYWVMSKGRVNRALYNKVGFDKYRTTIQDAWKERDIYTDPRGINNNPQFGATYKLDQVYHYDVRELIDDFKIATGLEMRIMTDAETENAMRVGILTENWCLTSDWFQARMFGYYVGYMTFDYAADAVDPIGPPDGTPLGWTSAYPEGEEAILPGYIWPGRPVGDKVLTDTKDCQYHAKVVKAACPGDMSARIGYDRKYNEDYSTYKSRFHDNSGWIILSIYDKDL